MKRACFSVFMFGFLLLASLVFAPQRVEVRRPVVSGETWGGYPARPKVQWMRQQATLARLTTSGDKAAAVALAHLGREAETKEAVTQLLELEPNFRIAEWVARTGSSKLQIYIDGLRKAGLPE